MSESLTEWEFQILREVACEIPASPWGAAIGEALEHLFANGYTTDTFGQITEKGRRLLADRSAEPPK